MLHCPLSDASERFEDDLIEKMNKPPAGQPANHKETTMTMTTKTLMTYIDGRPLVGIHVKHGSYSASFAAHYDGEVQWWPTMKRNFSHRAYNAMLSAAKDFYHSLT